MMARFIKDRRIRAPEAVATLFEAVAAVCGPVVATG